MSETVAEIDAAIARDKAAFNASRQRLAALLGPAMPKPEAEEIFIALAYEVGVARTLEDASRDAAYFDIAQPLDAAMAAKIEDALTDADRLHNAVIDNVARRENMLLRADPAHKPSYFWMGREFSIDPKMETITYKDTGEVCAFIQDDSSPRRPSSPSRDRSR
jgi:hypothetical protein